MSEVLVSMRIKTEKTPSEVLALLDFCLSEEGQELRRAIQSIDAIVMEDS